MEGSDFGYSLLLLRYFSGFHSLKKTKPTGKINLERDELLSKRLQKKESKNLLKKGSLKTQTKGISTPNAISPSGL